MNPTIPPAPRPQRLAALLTVALASPALSYNYAITPLAPGASESLPRSINNNNQVVGYMYTSGATAFLYSGGTTTTLLPFQGSGSNLSFSGSNAINDSGQIGGWVNGQPALLANGQLTSIGTLPGFPYGYVDAINNLGQAVGTDTPVISDESKGHAFLHSGNQNLDLGCAPGYSYSYARDINDAGQVVGASSTGDQLFNHPFLYSNGSMTDLGTLGGTLASAAAINATGTVVGSSMTTGSDWGTLHAFRYSNGTMRDLGTLPGTTISEAYDINAAGNIVGTTAIAVGQPSYHAFLYRNTMMFDLNSLVDPASGWTIVAATGINDAGSIIAVGTLRGSSIRQALLLTLIPEPATLGILAVAAGTFLRRSRRR